MTKHVCPFTKIFTFLNRKWVLSILRELSLNGPKRFTELERNIKGINSRILSQRRKEMVEMKIVTKKYYKELPPRVEYTLTLKGKDLLKCFKYLNQWIVKWK